MFFDEVEDFRCPECDAPRSAFFDANDKNDPHNQKVMVMQYASCTVRMPRNVVVAVAVVNVLVPMLFGWGSSEVRLVVRVVGRLYLLCGSSIKVFFPGSSDSPLAHG